MAKRKNRLGPLDHERRQLFNLKSLDPITTPDALRPLSNALIDLALAALDEVYRLEDGQTFEARRLKRLYQLAGELGETVPLEILTQDQADLTAED